jgi:hypothetical protein
MSDVYDVYQDVMSYHYVEGIIYQALFNNNPRKREKIATRKKVEIVRI